MPLLLDGEPLGGDSPPDVSTLLERSSSLKMKSSNLRDEPRRDVPPHHLLYVNQREYAVVCPGDDNVHILGTEDATTCHICVLRHSGSGVVALAHFDGVDMEAGAAGMLETIHKLSMGQPDGRLELHLVGGFCDNRKESVKISFQLLDIFIKRPEDIHLLCACIEPVNDRLSDGVHFPVIYGVGVNPKTGDIFPASFPDKGPAISVRSATHFVGFRKMMNIYDNGSAELKVGPFSWDPWEDIDMWVSLPDRVIRRHLSTSPEQEPAYFESHVRESLKVIQAHPEPLKTLFPDSQPWRHYMDQNGLWQRVHNKS